MSKVIESAQPIVQAAPFPVVRRITKTIRFREDHADRIQEYVAVASATQGRHVSQFEVIDQALTEFFARQKLRQA